MLTTEWLSAFAPVGIAPTAGKFAAIGAGVFFHHGDNCWIVTANHVLAQMPNQREFGVLIPSSSGDKLIVIALGVIQHKTGTFWVRDDANDLAISLMPVSDEYGFKAVSANFCLPLS